MRSATTIACLLTLSACSSAPSADVYLRGRYAPGTYAKLETGELDRLLALESENKLLRERIDGLRERLEYASEHVGVNAAAMPASAPAGTDSHAAAITAAGQRAYAAGVKYFADDSVTAPPKLAWCSKPGDRFQLLEQDAELCQKQ